LSRYRLLVSVGFSVLFSLALVYVSLEVIRIVNSWLLGFVPDCVLLSDFPRCQELESGLRIFGYAGLAAIIVVVGVGFLLNKTKLSLLGSLALYLPTIGYFAFTMFFLAGVGVLRLLWLPFIDSEIFFRLGLITYVPVWVINSVITWIARLVMPELSGDFSVPVSFAFMVVGLAIFFLGVMTWVSDKLGHRALSTRGVYRLSRHPQYLGFIIWSYGLLSLASVVEGGRGWSPPAPGLPWLVAVSIVLGVALIEEIELRRRLGVEYLRYAEQTPFIMLVPKVLSNVITYPVRILIGKEMPESRAEVAVVMFFYLLIAVITSYIVSYLVI